MNSNSYRPDSDDVGYYLRATANYTDSEGPGKSANAKTSAAVQADDDGRVALSEARPAVGDSVRATLTDPDGSITNTTWQWAISLDGESGWTDISGARSATYTVAAADVGNFLRATARYDDGDGTGKSAQGVSSVAVLEDDDGSVTLSPARPQVGNTITATLTDPDGGVTGARWQWASSSNGTTGWSNISGATSATYRVVDANVGNYLRATVNYGDAAGTGKSAEAITSAAVIEDDDGSVTLSPTSPEVGNTVTARLSDPDGGVSGLTWQWAISPNGTSNWTIILGATSATYTVTESHVGRYLRATASYDDAVGDDKDAEAVTSTAVREDDDGSVTLSITEPKVAAAITATLSDPDRPFSNVRWQWSKSSNGSTWTNIGGATSATYTAVAGDVGSYLRATASYNDSVGDGKSAEASTSARVAPLDLLGKFDSNRNGSIERTEAVDAVRDYFRDEITKDEVITILTLYFAG